MKVYKRVKFPIELTQGKADDLYRLRFMRRSELEPLLRHTMRYNNTQMGRQLNLWHKEQSLTIGSLNKEHDKVYQSQIRLRKELRRIKKEEYVRTQNEIREKLQDLRVRMIMMKVLKKFRDNVGKQKRARQNDLDKRLEVAHYVLNVPTQTDYPEDADELKKPVKDTRLSRARHKTATVLQRDSSRSILSLQTGRVNKTVETATYKPQPKTTLAQIRLPVTGTLSEVTVTDDDGNYDVSSTLLGRYPSSKGPRMETILEENNDELEIEVDDIVDRKLSFPSRKRRPINRSQSNRNVFDTNEQVPLLPEVNHVVTSQPRDTKEDKGTQTSFKHRRKIPGTDDNKDKPLVKKKLVVKLPSPVLSPTSPKTTKSSSSTYGHFGSDTDGCYPDSLSDSSDEGLYFDSDTVEPSGDYSTDLFDSPFSDDTLSDGRGGRLTITFDNYKQTLQRKQEYSPFSNLPKHQEEINIDEIPVRAVFPKQNPFSLRFKERSFYLQSSGFNEHRVSSARSHRRSDFKKESETLEEIRDRRLADIYAKMTAESARQSLDKTANMAVIGVKADSRKANIVPPNTPHVHVKNGFGQRSQDHPHASLQLDIQAQKKAQLYEKKKLHELVRNEPVPMHERTRQLSPFGSPRVCSHDIPTMKNLYYRDKLLKAERDKIIGQNMRMKKFIDTFDHLQECPYTGNQARPSHTISPVDSKSSLGSKKTFSGFIFEVQNTKGTGEHTNTAKVVTSSTPQRMLKDCRYLREYISIADKDYTATFTERRTSWQNKANTTSYYDNYVANVRLQL